MPDIHTGPHGPQTASDALSIPEGAMVTTTVHRITRTYIDASGGIAGLKDIAAALGVSRQRADVLSHTETFPESIGHVNESRAWLLGDILEWDKTRRTKPATYQPPSRKERVMPRAAAQRIRPGLYEITAPDGTVWTVEEREEPAAYGGGWSWYATSDHGDALDPLPRLKDVKAAIQG